MGYILPITNWTYHQYHLRTLIKEKENYSINRTTSVVSPSFDDILEKKTDQPMKLNKKSNVVTNEKSSKPK